MMPPETDGPQHGGDVLTFVCDVLCEDLALPRQAITPDDRLLDLPGADSVKLMHSVMRIEQHFGISLDDDDVYQLRTTRDLAELVGRSTAESRA
jgi:acyl carrier protein